MAPTNDEVLEALRAVEEPLLEQNLVDLGLVEATEVNRGGRIVVSIAEPVEGYPYADELREAILNLYLAGHLEEARKYLDYLVVNYKSLTDKSSERIIEVEWDTPSEEPLYQVDVEVDAWDRSGLLSDLMGVINEQKVLARSCKAWAKKDRAVIKLSLDIQHKKQLEELLKRMRKVKDVLTVERVTHSSACGRE